MECVIPLVHEAIEISATIELALEDVLKIIDNPLGLIDLKPVNDDSGSDDLS